MSEIIQKISNKVFALKYAKMGIKVFPCHSVKDKKCSCGKTDCTPSNAGKHPRTHHGVKDATTDETIITQWWTTHPDANIGGVTGTVSGFVVVDLDTKHGKTTQEMMAEMSSKGFSLSPTVTSSTGEYSGRRGLHAFYKAPKALIKSTTNILKKHGIEGVDVRGEHGYVILPPSSHFSGVNYEWVIEPENFYENN